MKFPKPRLRTICEKSRKQFTRLLPLAGLVMAVLTLTGASPIGRRPIGVNIPPTLGNYPAASIVLSGNTTVTPDAAPSNTTSINISTSTDFNGTLEGDPTTGVVRVTDAHPAGIYAVTVKAFNGSGEIANTTFNLTVTTVEACDPVSFTAPTNLNAGSVPNSVAVGDFNGDGKQDLAVAAQDTNKVLIYNGDGAGNFSAPTNFLTGIFPQSVVVGDFNGDGKQDVATANYFGNMSVLLGDGAGSFGPVTNIVAGSIHWSIVVGDFNTDGKQDLAITNSPNAVLVFLGNGTGSFSGPTSFSTGTDRTEPFSIVVGDFNGDGKQDLAVANEIANNVSILLGNGAGGFSGRTDFATGLEPTHLAVGDFNGDGSQDLAVTNRISNNVSILLGDGAGNFSAPTNLAAGSVPNPILVGDFDGDGKQDLAVANSGSTILSIFLGDGAGGFSTPTNFSSNTIATSLAVGDFNGDGKQDVAITNFDISTYTLSVLLRNCATNGCMVCHKHTTTLTLPCDSMELQRHLDHGDTAGQCPSN